MDRTVLHVVLGDSTGALWGVVLLLAVSLGLGLLTYGMVKRLALTSEGAAQTTARTGRSAGIACGVMAALVVFVGLYVPSLAGFYDLQVRGDQVMLHYLFPARYVTQLAVNVLKVDKEPAFPSKWRLVVQDVDGAVYQSALTGQQEVQQALSALQPVIEPDAAPRP